jgi:cyclin A
VPTPSLVTPPKKKARIAVHDPIVPVSESESVSEYVNWRKAEKNYMANAKYMCEQQTDINHRMRTILVDWLSEVVAAYKLAPQTLCLTVNYLDRFLSRSDIHRTKLQLVGITCLLVAAKFEEIRPILLEELLYICDNAFSRQEVMDMELMLLNQLRFLLFSRTPVFFLDRLTSHLNLPKTVVLRAQFFGELFLQEPAYLSFTPSLVAVSVLFFSMFTEDASSWPEYLTKLSGYSYESAKACLTELHGMCNRTLTLPPLPGGGATVRKYADLKCPLPSLSELTAFKASIGVDTVSEASAYI